jgi:F420-dependent oxidoreductase-like protein
MDLRIFTEPQDGATYDDLLRVATAAEDLGFDAFFRSDHYLHMTGDGLPGPTDAWITLAALARDTSRIRLGTLVTPVTFRLPGPLAISVAQVDQMSGGRVELGLGAGWFEAEHVAYGMPFYDSLERFDRFDEQLRIIHGLFNTPLNETFSFDGKYYQLSESPARPKPVQTPLPIIVGGAGKARSAALAATYATEFNTFDRLGAAPKFARVREAAAKQGRTLIYSAAQTACIGRDDAEVQRRADAIGWKLDDLRRDGLAGSVNEVVDTIGQFTEMGVTRLYLQIFDLSDLDHLELIASQIAPQLS